MLGGSRVAQELRGKFRREVRKQQEGQHKEACETPGENCCALSSRR